MERSNSPVFFGEWVKKRRKLMDLTQEELAQRTGCTIFTVRKIESGERRPSKQLAELLSVALELSAEDIATFKRVARGELVLRRLQDPSFDSSLPSISDLQAGSRSSSIPIQPTPLIGRDSEIAAMERLFGDPQCRLLSLTGMGGIGKTRLAIEFASRQRSKFGGGVFYVPLAPVKTSDAIIPVIADVLGFTFSGPTDPEEQLVSFLTKQKSTMHMVLDNLEHLLVSGLEMEKKGLVELVSELLRRLPNLKILATSRERLNLMGEWTYELHGLAVPPGNYLDKLESYSAVALFLQTARRVKVDFDLLGPEKPAIIQICQLLDGIPLAIELAAAWVGILSCQEIAQEIHSNIDFLTSSIHDIPKRHQSIRASFDHSWKLLSVEERNVLSRLSVFHGGFERMASERIASATLLLLASLVSKSLVRRSESGRYDLHEVIRQYASLNLKEAPRHLEIYERHFEYYISYIQDREKSLRSASQLESIHQLTGELDNIRAAWTWGIHHQKYTRLGEAVRSLGWYFEVAGLPREGLDQIEPLLEALRSKHNDAPELQIAYGSALAQQALLNFRKGEIFYALLLYEESESALRQVDNRSLLAETLVFSGIIQHLCGEYDRARALVVEGLALARSSNEKWFEAYAVYNLGYIDSLLGSYQDGYDQMLVGLNLWRDLGDEHYIALGLNFLVPTLNELGRQDEAIANMHESIALCEKTKNRWGLGTAYRFLGLATMSAGLFNEAQNHFNKSLEIFTDYTHGWDIAQTLFYLGEVKLMVGDLSNSRKIFLETLCSAAEARATPITLDTLLGLAQIYAKMGQAENAVNVLTCVLNNPASTQKTKDLAEKLSSDIEKLLTCTQLQVIQEKALNQSLEDLVNDLTQS